MVERASFGELVASLKQSHVLQEWRKRYSVEVALKENSDEIKVHLSPIPPDTLESLYEEVVQGGEVERLEQELRVSCPSVGITYEHCIAWGTSFTMYVVNPANRH